MVLKCLADSKFIKFSLCLNALVDTNCNRIGLILSVLADSKLVDLRCGLMV